LISPPGGLLLYNGATSGTGYKIGAAFPVDASYIYWSKSLSNPVLSPGLSGAWDDAEVKDPALVKVAGTYHLFYAGQDGSTYKVGKATSTDGITWTKDASNPVLTTGGASAWDEAQVSFPFVVHDLDEADSSRRWKMWYAGSAAATPEKFSVGYAYSSDGVTWTKYANNPVVSPGTAGAWDDEGCISPAVYRTASNDWTLFYGGRPQTGGTSNYKIGRVTFSNPEGTYTKDGSNPVISPSTAIENLSANMAAGARTLSVADTTGFSVGEPVFLRDTTGAIQQSKITAIVANASITIADDTSRAWTTANTATIRSAYYESITPKSIVLVGSTFVLYGTAFQQFSGSPFQERSVAWTAASIGGVFSVDHARGVFLALGSWDSASAENPAVVTS